MQQQRVCSVLLYEDDRLSLCSSASGVQVPHSAAVSVSVDMADSAIAAAVSQRAASVDAQNGNNRREYGGKRQRTDDGAAPAASSLPVSTAPPISSNPEASVNTIADFVESLADYEPTVRKQQQTTRE